MQQRPVTKREGRWKKKKKKKKKKGGIGREGGETCKKKEKHAEKDRRNSRGWENARVFPRAWIYIERRGISFRLFYRRSVKQRVRDRSIEQDRGSFNGCGHHAKNTFSRERSLFSMQPRNDCFHRPISSLKRRGANVSKPRG